MTRTFTVYAFLLLLSQAGCSKDSPTQASAVVVPGGMVSVTGGTFQMGSSDPLAVGGQPVHTVTVGSVFMDKYEVTYEKWVAVRTWGLTDGYLDMSTAQNGASPIGVNNPVDVVTWYFAVKWCNARSEMEGLTPVYYTNAGQTTVYRTGDIDLDTLGVKWSANGYRLPTEAEWEFAARGGMLSKNYVYAGSNTSDEVAWGSGNSGGKSHQVGTKLENELGLFDMTGSVSEWCWDKYSAYTSVTQINPKGTQGGTTRVYRGGSLVSNNNALLVATRSNLAPNYNSLSIGLRCVRGQ